MIRILSIQYIIILDILPVFHWGLIFFNKKIYIHKFFQHVLVVKKIKWKLKKNMHTCN